MFTNFWVVLNRRNGDTSVNAGGPLPWLEIDPDAKKVRIEATVTDRNGVSAADGVHEFTPKDDKWEFDVSTAGGARMQRGRAHARGWLTVIDPPGGARELWEQDVWVN